MKLDWVLMGGVGLLLLAGCSSQPTGNKALEDARTRFQQIKADPEILRTAPKDVVRAEESLARAETLATYWGTSADVAHYAYLSQRYSEIAEQESLLEQNQQKLAKLDRQLQNLQLILREDQLLTLEQRREWVAEQLISLDSTETERGLVMTLGDVLFAGGSANLTPAANRTILKLAQFLQLNPRRVIRVEGYSDSNGDEVDNLKLSRERAQSVVDMLGDLGVEAKRMSVVGYGEAYPVADNASTRGRAQNRRVEIVISDQQGNLSPPR